MKRADYFSAVLSNLKAARSRELTAAQTRNGATTALLRALVAKKCPALGELSDKEIAAVKATINPRRGTGLTIAQRVAKHRAVNKLVG